VKFAILVTVVTSLTLNLSSAKANEKVKIACVKNKPDVEFGVWKRENNRDIKAIELQYITDKKKNDELFPDTLAVFGGVKKDLKITYVAILMENGAKTNYCPSVEIKNNRVLVDIGSSWRRRGRPSRVFVLVEK
jgi:hypothetical protein